MLWLEINLSPFPMKAKGVTLKIVGCIVLLYLDLVWKQWHEVSVVGIIMPQLRRGDQG